jgi:hypothetical protein
LFLSYSKRSVHASRAKAAKALKAEIGRLAALRGFAAARRKPIPERRSHEVPFFAGGSRCAACVLEHAQRTFSASSALRPERDPKY